MLITGPGSGIGRALALDAARRGMHLMLAGRTRAALDETVSLLPAGAQAHVVAADVRSPDSRALLRRAVDARFGGLDLLIHNAGVQWAGPIEAVADEALHEMIDTNLIAPMALTRELLGMLRAASPARVVFIGSMFGDIGFPLFAGYSASKAGLRVYADALRRELAPLGVGVTYAAPRATATALTARVPHLTNAFALELDAPEEVAARVMRAVEREARHVYPRWPERLLAALHGIAPSLVDAGVLRQFRQALERLGPQSRLAQGPVPSVWPEQRRFRSLEP